MAKSVNDERMEAARRALVAPGHEYCPRCSRKGTRVYHLPGHHADTRMGPEKPIFVQDSDTSSESA